MPPSPGSPLVNRKGVPISPDRIRYNDRGESQSPIRRPATPLRGIGKFLQHRRRDASPDSPSVRSDLLSGSVVAGLVAAAIQEVEASAPDPQTNKPMADLIERAVKAEFKVGQLELQKKQLWQLVSIEEEQTQKERAKQTKFVFFIAAMLGMEVILLGAVSLQGSVEATKWIGSLAAIHLSMGFTAAYMFEQLCFARKGDEDDESDEDEDDEMEQQPEEELSREEAPQHTEGQSSQQQQVPSMALKVQEALEEFKETIALLPIDQKGLEWITQGGDALLMRFLRAHALRVGKAFKYLIKCAEWRVEMNMDSLVDSWERKNTTRSAQLLKDTWPLFNLGAMNDGKGDRVFLLRLAMSDFPGYYRACAAEDVTKHSLYEFERNRISCKRHAVLIVDLGYNESDTNRPINSVGQLRAWIAGLMQYLSTMTKLVDPYFPDTFSRVIFTRAPAPFWATWRVAQLLIPQQTRDKTVILTGDSMSDRLKELLQGQERCIPDFLGGTFAADWASKGGLIVRHKTTAELSKTKS